MEDRTQMQSAVGESKEFRPSLALLGQQPPNYPHPKRTVALAGPGLRFTDLHESPLHPHAPKAHGGGWPPGLFRKSFSKR